MIDISNLTSLITAFRQETEQGCISPETLGALLQAIANQLHNATTRFLVAHFFAFGQFLDALYNSKADGENPPALFIVCIKFLLLTS